MRVMMDSETVRVTPSEKTKLYLSKKLNEIEQKIKKTEKKKKALQILGVWLFWGV